MSIISKPVTVVAGQNAKATDINQDLDTIYNDYNGNITNANIVAGAAIATTKLNLTTLDLSSTTLTLPPLTNYAGLTTSSGWVTVNYNYIQYKKIGSTVFVNFYLQGTSNANSASFTLPYACGNTEGVRLVLGRQQDNGAESTTPGILVLAYSSTTVSCYKDGTGASWSTAGQKIIGGQFFYESM